MKNKGGNRIISIKLQSSKGEFPVVKPEILKILQEASSAIVGTFELESLLQKVVESYRNISRASACSIFLIDGDKNELVMRAGVGYEKDLKEIAEYDLAVNADDPKIGVTAWIALTKRSFSAKTREELTSHPAWWGKYVGQQYKGDERSKSFIGMPLVVHDKVIGVLKAENKIHDAEHPEPYFTSAEEQSLEILANTVAIAIENVRLIEERRKNLSLRIAESMHKVSSVVVGTFELDEILQGIVESFKDISNATACSIFLVDDDRKHIRMKAGVGYEKDFQYEAEYDLTVDPDDQGIGLTAWIALTKQQFSARTRNELTSHYAWKGKYDGQQYKGDEQCQSFIGVPLLIRDEVIGVLKAENKITNRDHPESYFTIEEEQVFEILSNMAAIVVRNATLITEEEKKRIDRIVNVYRIAGALQEQDDIDRLIYIFLTGLAHSKAIGFDRAMFFEYRAITKHLVGRMAVGPLDKEGGEGLTIEASVRAFDKGGRTLDTELNRLLSDTVIDLEKKGDLCVEWAAKGENDFEEYDVSSFSANLKSFLERIESEKVILIGVASSKDRYNFVFCDYINSQKPFDQSTRKLLKDFVGQTSRAFERIQSSDEIKAAREAAWQEVSAMAAHRLGNILPFTENRLNDSLRICGDNTELQNLLKSCYEDVRIAINVLGDFKRFAAAGRINLSHVDDINNIMKQIETLLKADFKDVNIQTSYLKQHIPHVRVDFDAIKMVFLNLLSNTGDAKPENPDATIRTELPSDSELKICGLRPNRNFIKIVYEDNGPGIPDKEKKEVFEAFFTHKAGSSGLGLAIVHRIIEQHGGKIFEDGVYNQGVRFNIILPSVAGSVLK